MISRPSTTAFSGNSYADVMRMLYSVPISKEVKEHIIHRLVLEVCGDHISRAIDRVIHLASLPSNWDGEGASPILPEVISNIREVLLNSKDSDWSCWTISPNVNGTIFLQSTKHMASLSIGSQEYSYFSKKEGVREGKSHLPFTATSFLSDMRMLNE